jgi:hypothetical protein
MPNPVKAILAKGKRTPDKETRERLSGLEMNLNNEDRIEINGVAANPREIKFAEVFAETRGDRREAIEASYNSVSERGKSNQASRLLSKPHVRQLIRFFLREQNTYNKVSEKMIELLDADKTMMTAQGPIDVPDYKIQGEAVDRILKFEGIAEPAQPPKQGVPHHGPIIDADYEDIGFDDLSPLELQYISQFGTVPNKRELAEFSKGLKQLPGKVDNEDCPPDEE